MKSIALLLTICLSFSQSMDDYDAVYYSLLDNCENGCLKCWSDTASSCYSCLEGYIFGEKGVTTCYKPDLRSIIGYGRQCAACGEGNYLDEKFHCKPCPYKCKGCELNQNKELHCTVCKGNISNTYGYILEENCSCVYGDELHNKGCYCNDISRFIEYNEDKTAQACKPCTHCDRRHKNCKNYLANIECEDALKYTYDPLDIESQLIEDLEADICCQPCDETCKTCKGPTQKDCKTCRNEDLYEMVKDECMCVCNAGWVTKTDGSHECKCLFGTVKTDVCDGQPCLDSTMEEARYQCLCPNDTIKSSMNADGSFECLKQ